MSGLEQRARALAEHHRELARLLDCAAGGHPERLYGRRYRGGLDTELACLERDFRRREEQIANAELADAA